MKKFKEKKYIMFFVTPEKLKKYRVCAFIQ